MNVFVSYARRDRESVEQLVALLKRAKNDVWFDSEIIGGQRWWDEILRHLRTCDVVLASISPDALRSKACKAELTYAAALGKVVLPVLVRDTNLDLAPAAIGTSNVVDFRDASAHATVELIEAVRSLPVAPPEPS